MKQKEGLSIIEVIVAVAISALIVLAVGRFSDAISGIGTLLGNGLQADQNVTLVLQTMESEVRSMGSSAAGAYPLETAGTSTIVFYSDTDQDGVNERIRYTIGTSTIEKGIIKATSTPAAYPTSTEVKSIAAANIRPGSSTFEYFDAGYTGTEAPLAQPVSVSAVRVVRVTISVDVSTSTAPRPITLIDVVTIRNLKSN